MSNLIPVYQYPGGTKIDLKKLIENDVTYKWINDLGGAELPGPLEWGAVRPDGKDAHGGVLTTVDGVQTIEYHYGF